ncbi:MAG: hypothetical protein QM756_38365 [Polyangiaceae bacterium]
MKRWLQVLALSIGLSSATARAESERWLATDDARDCAVLADGRIVAATAGGLLSVDARGRPSVLTALDGLPDTHVERLRVSATHVELETRKGRARLSLRDGSFALLSGVSVARPSEPSAARELPSGVMARATHERAGSRCYATDHGLFVGRLGALPKRIELPALPSGDISALASGRERVFVGSFDQGLWLLGAGRVERVAGINPNINALVWDEARGALWAGTARGLWRCTLASETLACRRAGQPHAVHALLGLRGGALAVGTEQGLTLLDGERERVLGAKQGAPFRAVWALAESASGELFVGTTSGLYWAKTSALLQPERPLLERASLVSGELPDDWVTAIHARGDELYVGTYNAGVVGFRRGTSGLLALGTDASLGYVNAGGIGSFADGRLWVATMDGLRIGTLGSFATLPTLGRDVTAVVEAHASGEHWIATRRGLERRRIEPVTITSR